MQPKNASNCYTTAVYCCADHSLHAFDPAKLEEKNTETAVETFGLWWTVCTPWLTPLFLMRGAMAAVIQVHEQGLVQLSQMVISSWRLLAASPDCETEMKLCCNKLWCNSNNFAANSAQDLRTHWQAHTASHIIMKSCCYKLLAYICTTTYVCTWWYYYLWSNLCRMGTGE